MSQFTKLSLELKWLLVEGVILFLGMPFFLFPETARPITTITAITLATTWLIQAVLKTRPLFPPTPIRTASIILSIQAGLAIVVSADRDLTFAKATGLLLGVALLRFLSYFIDNRKTLSIVIILFLLMGLGLTSVGVLTADWSRQKIDLLQAIIQQIPSFSSWLSSAPTGGTHTNQIGGAILFYIFLLPALFPVLRQRRWLLSAVILLSILVSSLLILTQSRSGYAGFAGGFGLLMILFSCLMPVGTPRRVMRWATAALTVLTFTFLLWLVITGRLAEIWTDPSVDTAVGSLGTIKFRQEVWEWGLIAAGDFIFTGTGLGTFREVVHRLYPIAIPVTYDIAHAHNQFLQVQLDLGIFGLIAYIAMIMLALRMCWQVMRESAELLPYAIGFTCCIISFHIYGMTDAIALGAKPGILWWMLLGLVVGMYRIHINDLLAKHHNQDEIDERDPN